MNPNKISAVIFDMDGLMFETESLFAIAQSDIAKRYGKVFTLEIQNKMMGRKPLDAIKVMLEELEIDEDAEKIAKERDDAYRELIKVRSQPMTGLFDFLDLLDKNGIRKAIASGSHHEWINTLLSQTNIKHRFEVIVSGQDVQVAKPDPEIYTKTVKMLELLPSQCLVLEDAVNGIRAAKAAGCCAVAVPNDYTRHLDFSEADHVVASLMDPALLCLIEG